MKKIILLSAILLLSVDTYTMETKLQSKPTSWAFTKGFQSKLIDSIEESDCVAFDQLMQNNYNRTVNPSANAAYDDSSNPSYKQCIQNFLNDNNLDIQKMKEHSNKKVTYWTEEKEKTRDTKRNWNKIGNGTVNLGVGVASIWLALTGFYITANTIGKSSDQQADFFWNFGLKPLKIGIAAVFCNPKIGIPAIGLLGILGYTGIKSGRQNLKIGTDYPKYVEKRRKAAENIQGKLDKWSESETNG